ncbi:MAG: ABC transporter ATP-binding protein [Acidobacteria bacterium]|nr:ABC transporter ATP-binding protein [Acidobacteriota bacterium]
MPNGYEIRDHILQVRNVSLKLGGNQILRDLSFEIRDIHRDERTTGQIVGLLGPSGIGKTQLFRILAGLGKPDSGEVLVGSPGKKVERGMVGVVAQQYPLFEHRTVWSNLIVAAARSGRSEAESEKRGYELLERFKLLDRKTFYPAQLSGGQRQRVAIAQQIMCSEQFLLMDEPFSGLDVVALDAVQELINEVTHANTLNSTIVVSHDIVAVCEIADQVVLLGRDVDETGRVVPGAKVMATYDLAERGLAWRRGIASDPEFLRVVEEIRGRFPLL